MIDLTRGRLRTCPLPPGKFGILRIAEFQMRAGVSEANIMVQEYPNGTVVRFLPGASVTWPSRLRPCPTMQLAA